MIRRFRFTLPFLLAALSLLPLQGRTQTQGIDFVSGNPRFDFTITNASWAVGFQFSARNPITVYNLGFYDSGIAPTTNPGSGGTSTMPDGFTTSHAVGIYDVTTTTARLLVQTVVPQNSTLLDGNFRYAADLRDGAGNAITGPFILPASGAFIIVGVSNGENYTYVQSGTLRQDLNVAYSHSVYQLSSSLLIPNLQDAAFGYFGPNFTTSAFPTAGVPTPEPGSAAFAACATVAGLLWRVKRLRRAHPDSACA